MMKAMRNPISVSGQDITIPASTRCTKCFGMHGMGSLIMNALAAMVIVLLFAGCAEKTKEKLLQEGLAQMDDNNLRGAIVLFRSALQKDQGFFEARFHLARAYFEKGDFDSAEKELQKVIRQNPYFKDAHVVLAHTYLKKLKPDDALRQIDEFIASDDADALELAGMAYAAKGDHAAALKFLKKAVSGGRDKVTANISLAKVYMEMGDIAKAMSRISVILDKDASNASALFMLAELQERNANFDAAAEAIESILRKNPADFRALYKKANLLIRKGQYSDALSVSNTIIKSYPDMPEGYRLKGMSLFHENKLDDAVVFLQKALSIRPDAAGHYFLGLCHYKRKEYEQAISQLYRSLDLDASFVQARALVSLILLIQKRVDDSIAEIKRVIHLNEEDAVAHIILGNAYIAKGVIDEGINELERALEINPEIVDARITMGLFNLSKGRVEESEAELLTALNAAPEALNTRVILSALYIRKKEYDRAIRILRNGLVGGKSDVVLYNLIASALKQQDRVDDAINYLKKAKDSNPEIDISYFNLASLYFLSGDYDRAIQELKAVVKRSPDDLKAYLIIACICELKGDERAALDYYMQASKTGEPSGYIALARYYLREGEKGNAVAVLEEATEKKPILILYDLLGRTLNAMGRHEDAVAAFREVERIRPGRGMPGIVNSYIRMKKYESAMNIVQKELKAHPNRLDLMTEVSRIYLSMGEKQKAIDNANAIIAGSPESPVGYLVLGMIYKIGNPDRAIEVIRSGISANEKNLILYVVLGNLYAMKKDFNSALDAYRKAEKIKAGYIRAISRQGATLHAAGRREEAALEYKRVIGLSRNHAMALNNIAFLYAEDGKKPTQALHYASRAFLVDSSNASILDTFGFVLLKNGKASESVNILEKAARLMPRPSIYYHLSMAYKELGDKGSALDNLRKALESDSFAEKELAELLLSELTDRRR
jgi:putative PEP-CTERM system TPR-repeat lipoprotein